MLHKFQLLKSSWGIVIFLDVTDLSSLTHNEEREKVTDTIYLSLKEKNVQKEKLIYWFSRAIADVEEEIKKAIANEFLYLEVNAVQFNYADFQDEGLYYAMQEWLSKRYGFERPPYDAFFDAKQNRYVFPALKVYVADAPK